jgi:translation initiation factor 4E
MLAAIGETLEKEGDDEVMGVVVNARKGFYRIGLWTKSCTNAEVLKAIGYISYFPPVSTGANWCV